MEPPRITNERRTFFIPLRLFLSRSIKPLATMQTAVLRSAAPCAVLNSSRRSATTRAFAPARRVAVSRRGAVSCRAHCGVSFFFRRRREEKKREQVADDLVRIRARSPSERQQHLTRQLPMATKHVAMYLLVQKGGFEMHNRRAQIELAGKRGIGKKKN